MPDIEVLNFGVDSPVNQSILSKSQFHLWMPPIVPNNCSYDEAQSIVSKEEGVAIKSFQIVSDALPRDLLLRSDERHGSIIKLWLGHHIAR